MKFSIFKTLVLVIGLSSCYQTDQESDVKKIYVGDTDQDNIADYVNDFEYIQLETSNDCMMQDTYKVKFYDGVFYICDSNADVVFLFNENGKYLRKISHKGRGAGEYSNSDGFEVDQEGNVYILDFTRKSLYKYSTYGDFITRIKFPNVVNDVVELLGGECLMTYQVSPLSGNVSHKLMIDCEGDGQRVGHSLPMNIEVNSRFVFESMWGLWKSPSIIYFHDNFSDTIYSVNRESVVPKYYLDFGEYTLSPDQREYLKTGKSFDREASLEETLNTFTGLEAYGQKIADVYQNSKYLTCSYTIDEYRWVLFYNPETKKMIKNNSIKEMSEPQKVISNFRVAGMANDKFFSIVDSNMMYRLKRKVKEDMTGMLAKYGKKNVDMITSYEMSNNPIIVLFDLSF